MSVDLLRLVDELLARKAELRALDPFSDERRDALARFDRLADRVIETGRRAVAVDRAGRTGGEPGRDG